MKTTLHPIPKALIIMLMLFAWAIPALQAQYTLTSEDVIIENGTITKLKTHIDKWGTGDIIIPDKIDGQTVTGIGNDWVFLDEKLTSVVLPKNITRIGNQAFFLNSITELTIPDKCAYIGSQTFRGNKMKSIYIPKSIIAIGEQAFSENEILEVVFEENSNIRIIANNAFSGNAAAKPILPSNSNEGFVGYIDNNGRKYDVGSRIENFDLFYYADLPIRTLTANDVRLVDGEILECAVYKDIIIPDVIENEKVISIGAEAFSFHFIKTFKIPKSIKQIKQGAFWSNDIESLTIPNTISVIEGHVFCANPIDTVILPSSIISIGDSAFFWNYTHSVYLPNSITSIGICAFKENFFKEVILPNSVRYIGKEAFKLTNKGLYENKDEFFTTIPLPHPVINEGYIFTHWKDGKGVTVTEMTDLETSYTAQFTPTQSYQVSGTVLTDETAGLLLYLSGDFDGVRAISDSGIFQFPLNTGRNITVTPIREGYLFFPESITINNIQTNRTELYFTSSIADYDVNFSAGENGSITGETSQNRAYKQSTSPVTAVPNSGYKFTTWKDQKGAVLSTENPIVIEVRSDMEVTAVFEAIVGFKANSEVNLQCYPNPVSNNLTIVAPQNIQKVELYNSLGERVFKQENINKNTINLNLAQYIKGVCFVHVSGKGFTQVVKVVVE